MKKHANIYKLLFVVLFTLSCNDGQLLDQDAVYVSDKTNNIQEIEIKIDESNVEQHILSLSEDKYIKRLLTLYMEQMKLVIENTDNIEVLKKANSEMLGLIMCFKLLSDDLRSNWSTFESRISRIFLYNDERVLLMKKALATMSGHSFSLPIPKVKRKEVDWMWDFYCPLHFEEGDRDKYYIPWKKKVDERNKWSKSL